jgi:hypothetical protein
MAVASDFLALGLASNMILLIELARAENIVRVSIPRKPAEFALYKLFLDPSGRHLLITSHQGENWYLYRGWQKPRVLKSVKMVLESVAWHTRALLSGPGGSTSTRELLLGARGGTVYEALLDAEDDFFRGQERYLQPVFTLPERAPVTGLAFTLLGARALVLVTTPTRMYQFVGMPDRKGDDQGRLFAGVFAAYKDKHLRGSWSRCPLVWC